MEHETTVGEKLAKNSFDEREGVILVAMGVWGILAFTTVWVSARAS